MLIRVLVFHHLFQINGAACFCNGGIEPCASDLCSCKSVIVKPKPLPPVITAPVKICKTVLPTVFKPIENKCFKPLDILKPNPCKCQVCFKVSPLIGNFIEKMKCKLNCKHCKCACGGILAPLPAPVPLPPPAPLPPLPPPPASAPAYSDQVIHT